MDKNSEFNALRTYNYMERHQKIQDNAAAEAWPKIQTGDESLRLRYRNQQLRTPWK